MAEGTVDKRGTAYIVIGYKKVPADGKITYEQKRFVFFVRNDKVKEFVQYLNATFKKEQGFCAVDRLKVTSPLRPHFREILQFLEKKNKTTYVVNELDDGILQLRYTPKHNKLLLFQPNKLVFDFDIPCKKYGKLIAAAFKALGPEIWDATQIIISHTGNIHVYIFLKHAAFGLKNGSKLSICEYIKRKVAETLDADTQKAKIVDKVSTHLTLWDKSQPEVFQKTHIDGKKCIRPKVIKKAKKYLEDTNLLFERIDEVYGKSYGVQVIPWKVSYNTLSELRESTGVNLNLPEELIHNPVKSRSVDDPVECEILPAIDDLLKECPVKLVKVDDKAHFTVRGVPTTARAALFYLAGLNEFALNYVLNAFRYEFRLRQMASRLHIYEQVVPDIERVKIEVFSRIYKEKVPEGKEKEIAEVNYRDIKSKAEEAVYSLFLSLHSVGELMNKLQENELSSEEKKKLILEEYKQLLDAYTYIATLTSVAEKFLTQLAKPTKTLIKQIVENNRQSGSKQGISVVEMYRVLRKHSIYNPFCHAIPRSVIERKISKYMTQYKPYHFVDGVYEYNWYTQLPDPARRMHFNESKTLYITCRTKQTRMRIEKTLGAAHGLLKDSKEILKKCKIDEETAEAFRSIAPIGRVGNKKKFKGYAFATMNIIISVAEVLSSTAEEDFNRVREAVNKRKDKDKVYFAKPLHFETGTTKTGVLAFKDKNTTKAVESMLHTGHGISTYTSLCMAAHNMSNYTVVAPTPVEKLVDEKTAAKLKEHSVKELQACSVSYTKKVPGYIGSGDECEPQACESDLVTASVVAAHNTGNRHKTTTLLSMNKVYFEKFLNETQEKGAYPLLAYPYQNIGHYLGGTVGHNKKVEIEPVKFWLDVTDIEKKLEGTFLARHGKIESEERNALYCLADYSYRLMEENFNMLKTRNIGKSLAHTPQIALAVYLSIVQLCDIQLRSIQEEEQNTEAKLRGKKAYTINSDIKETVKRWNRQVERGTLHKRSGSEVRCIRLPSVVAQVYSITGFMLRHGIRISQIDVLRIMDALGFEYTITTTDYNNTLAVVVKHIPYYEHDHHLMLRISLFKASSRDPVSTRGVTYSCSKAHTVAEMDNPCEPYLGFLPPKARKAFECYTDHTKWFIPYLLLFDVEYRKILKEMFSSLFKSPFFRQDIYQSILGEFAKIVETLALKESTGEGLTLEEFNRLLTYIRETKTSYHIAAEITGKGDKYIHPWASHGYYPLLVKLAALLAPPDDIEHSMYVPHMVVYKKEIDGRKYSDYTVDTEVVELMHTLITEPGETLLHVARRYLDIRNQMCICLNDVEGSKERNEQLQAEAERLIAKVMFCIYALAVEPLFPTGMVQHKLRKNYYYKFHNLEETPKQENSTETTDDKQKKQDVIQASCDIMTLFSKNTLDEFVVQYRTQKKKTIPVELTSGEIVSVPLEPVLEATRHLLHFYAAKHSDLSVERIVEEVFRPAAEFAISTIYCIQEDFFGDERDLKAIKQIKDEKLRKAVATIHSYLTLNKETGEIRCKPLSVEALFPPTHSLVFEKDRIAYYTAVYLDPKIQYQHKCIVDGIITAIETIGKVTGVPVLKRLRKALQPKPEYVVCAPSSLWIMEKQLERNSKEKRTLRQYEEQKFASYRPGAKCMKYATSNLECSAAFKLIYKNMKLWLKGHNDSKSFTLGGFLSCIMREDKYLASVRHKKVYETVLSVILSRLSYSEQIPTPNRDIYFINLPASQEETQREERAPPMELSAA